MATLSTFPAADLATWRDSFQSATFNVSTLITLTKPMPIGIVTKKEEHDAIDSEA